MGDAAGPVASDVDTAMEDGGKASSTSSSTRDSPPAANLQSRAMHQIFSEDADEEDGIVKQVAASFTYSHARIPCTTPILKFRAAAPGQKYQPYLNTFQDPHNVCRLPRFPMHWCGPGQAIR